MGGIARADGVGTAQGGAEEIRGTGSCALQRRAANGRRLGEAKQAAFLAALAGSCNVTRAAREAGAAEASFYRLRQRDEAFAAAWEAAMATGYARLEAELMATALGERDPEQDGRSPIDPDLAVKMLGRRDAAARSSNPSAYGRATRTRHVPMAEVEAALRRQLDLLAKRLGERPAAERPEADR